MQFSKKFKNDQRVEWVEAHSHVTCRGYIVTCIYDFLGNPTNFFLIHVDADYREHACTVPSERVFGMVERHAIMDEIRPESVTCNIDFW